jgi:hypothetical protein
LYALSRILGPHCPCGHLPRLDRIETIRVSAQDVTDRMRLDPVGSEKTPEPGYCGVQCARSHRTKERIRQLVGRHDLIRPQGEHGEKRPLALSAR